MQLKLSCYHLKIDCYILDKFHVQLATNQNLQYIRKGSREKKSTWLQKIITGQKKTREKGTKNLENNQESINKYDNKFLPINNYIKQEIKFSNKKMQSGRVDQNIRSNYMMPTRGLLHLEGHTYMENGKIEKNISYKWKPKESGD